MLVCHSMGGLVASAYISQFGDSQVDKLITLGTPYLGSPKCALAHFNGEILPFSLNSGSIRQLSFNYSSCYQLLPTKRYFENDYYIIDGNNLVKTYAGTKELLKSERYKLTGLLDKAEAFHDSLYTGSIHTVNAMDSSKHNVYTIAGDKKFTIDKLFTYSNSLISYVKQYTSTNGDGTVPLLSATIGGTTNPERTYYISEEHTNLARNQNILDLVVNIINGQPNTYDDTVISRKSHDLGDYIKLDVACPVDVQVYNNDGNLLGEISGNQAQEAFIDGGAFFTAGENNDRKIIYLDASRQYKFKLSGTDTGMIDYSMSSFDENGKEEKRVSYSSVPLTNGYNNPYHFRFKRNIRFTNRQRWKWNNRFGNAGAVKHIYKRHIAQSVRHGITSWQQCRYPCKYQPYRTLPTKIFPGKAAIRMSRRFPTEPLRVYQRERRRSTQQQKTEDIRPSALLRSNPIRFRSPAKKQTPLYTARQTARSPSPQPAETAGHTITRSTAAQPGKPPIPSRWRRARIRLRPAIPHIQTIS